MKTDAFRAWLADTLSSNSAASYYSSVKRVEESYGDFDAAYDADQLQTILDNLTYSASDAKAGKVNPTRLTINGNPYNVLSNFKSAVRSYIQFREQEVAAASETAVELAGKYLQEKKEGKQFELERHLQESLREEIEQLEPGLEIVDGGVERSVESGSIDILARDPSGAIVAIELKRGQARREALGQLLGYMGDLKLEDSGGVVRGILVAADFDKSCRSAVTVVPSIKLARYRFRFHFEDVIGAA